MVEGAKVSSGNTSIWEEVRDLSVTEDTVTMSERIHTLGSPDLSATGVASTLPESFIDLTTRQRCYRHKNIHNIETDVFLT